MPPCTSAKDDLSNDAIGEDHQWDRSKDVCFVFICLLLPVVFLCQKISKFRSILTAVCFILCQNNVLNASDNE